MKRSFQFAFLLGMIFMICHSTANTQINPEEITIRKIWSDENHNAFGDLVYFRGNFYCSFRQGSDHVGGKDGLVRIIKSRDGINWKTATVLEKQGYDLRDPKLSVTPDGRIMVIMGGAVYKERKLIKRLTHVSFSNRSGKKFSDPQPTKVPATIKSDNDWIWRLAWHNNTGYGILYQYQDPFRLFLLKTADGINYDLIRNFDEIGDAPNETTVRVMPDGEMIMMVRRERGEQKGLWGRSKSPYTDWIWTDARMRFGGPDFAALNDDLLIAGTRVYDTPSYTGLFLVNRAGQFKKFLRLPSGGDNSYPGFVVGKDKVYVSYYSSHEGNSSIYFVEIPLSVIEEN